MAVAAQQHQQALRNSNQCGTSASSQPPHLLIEWTILICLQVTWHATLDTVPQDSPTIYLAHEFFDALPTHQFVKDIQRGWLEKMVDLADDVSAVNSDTPGLIGGGNQQQPQAPYHLRMVLSPSATPATSLLVPRRLRGMDEAVAQDVKAIEVRHTFVQGVGMSVCMCVQCVVLPVCSPVRNKTQRPITS